MERLCPLSLQRPLCEAAAPAGQAAQSQDTGDEAHPEPDLRRGLHLLRSDFRPASGKQSLEYGKEIHL